MLETEGRVIALEAGMAWVESTRQGGCGSCAAKGSCGSQLLGEALAPSPQHQALSRVLAIDPLGVQVGDRVLLGISDEGGLRAAWMMYGLPLFGLMSGLILAQPLGDLWAILAGSAGMVLALLAVHFWSNRQVQGEQTIRPMILARLAAGDGVQGACISKSIPIKPL